MAAILPSFFFFNDTATTEIYTLSLHDALPICALDMNGEAITQLMTLLTLKRAGVPLKRDVIFLATADEEIGGDRKSTRLNSSHSQISYAVFCLKKKTADHAGAAARRRLSSYRY